MECQEADPGARGSADGHGRDEVARLFGDAVRAHRAGQLAPAEHLYRRVLAVDPEHADSLHYLGVLALQTGRGRAALELRIKHERELRIAMEIRMRIRFLLIEWGADVNYRARLQADQSSVQRGRA